MGRSTVRRALPGAAIPMLAALVVSPLAARAQTPAAVSENVPVPGDIASLARALDIEAPDDARCLAEVARLVYAGTKENRLGLDSPYRRLIAHFTAARSASYATASDLVPVPLSATIWSRAVFRRAVTARTLFVEILSDEDAALLAHGLAALDDETLQFFAAHAELLATLHQRHAPVFASFAAHLRIRDNRVVPPGGDAAVPLWEAVLGARTTNPVSFVTALYGRANGRLAYLYDSVGHLDPARAAFALGLWLPDPTLRLERFRALAEISAKAFDEWDVTKAAFSRPVFDLLALLARVQVEPSGIPRFPASRALWAAVLSDNAPDATVTPGARSDASIDAAWLADVVLAGLAHVRNTRLDQFGFGQRTFAAAHDAATSELVTAISSFPRVPALMLTVERIGVRRPAVYAALARHAEELMRLPVSGQWRALAQFQAAIAIVQRMARVQTLQPQTADHLLTQLALIPVDADRGYLGAIATWLDRDLRPAVASSGSLAFDEAVVKALAGSDNEPTTTLAWEGQEYLFRLSASESARINRFLDRRRIASIEATLRIHAVAKALARGAVDERVADVVRELRAMLPRLPHTTRLMPRLGELPRSRDAALVLLEAVDILAADALMTLAYASEWHDPRGLARLDRDLHRRHDFGLTIPLRSWRSRTTWRLPRLVFKPGEPWRIEGAAMGLDVALASLALRSVDSAAHRASLGCCRITGKRS